MSWLRALADLLTHIEPASAPAPDPEPEVADLETWPIAGEAFPVHVAGEHGAVRLEGGRLSIAIEGGTPTSVRLDDVAALYLHGASSVSTPALAALMRRGVPLLWHGFDGRLIGQTLGLAGQSSATRQAQYAAVADPARRLNLARAFVAAKLGNARRLLLRRFGGRDPAARQIEALARKLPFAADLDRLRGLEGAAADAYFAAWPRLIAERHVHLAFARRSRRPPADPANAALSYLYAVLHGRCVAAGLDPTVGFLHAERAGRSALALDLMEPLRPLIVDAALIAGFNNGEYPPSAFERAEAGWRLTATGRRAALALFERRVAQPASAPSGRTTYRQAIAAQARDLARALRRGEDFTAFAPAR